MSMLQNNIIFLVIAISIFIGLSFINEEERTDIEYEQSQLQNITIFNHQYDKKFPEYIIRHPIMDDDERRFIAITTQEGKILKVAFYFDNMEDLMAVLYIENPQLRKFDNMAAKFIINGRSEFGIMFEDGTKLYSSLPRDTYPMPNPELSYDVRWRRIYKNYYLVTCFRGSGDAVSEGLMTEKDGKDLTSALGESSADKDTINICGYSVGQTIWLQYRVKENNKYKYLEATLVPVQEDDLPPDFPKGLVRWIP